MKNLDAVSDAADSLHVPAEILRSRDHKRELLEQLVVRLLSNGALREKFHFTPYNTISYIMLGTGPLSRALLNGSHSQPLPFELRLVRPPPVTTSGKQSSAAASSGSSTASKCCDDDDNNGDWLSTSSKPAASASSSSFSAANSSASRASAGDSKLKSKPAQLTFVGAQQSVFARSRSEISAQKKSNASVSASACNSSSGEAASRPAAVHSRANKLPSNQNPSASKTASPKTWTTNRSANFNLTGVSDRTSSSASKASFTASGSTAPAAAESNSKRLKLELEQSDDEVGPQDMSDEMLLSVLDEFEGHPVPAEVSSNTLNEPNDEFNFD